MAGTGPCHSIKKGYNAGDSKCHSSRLPSHSFGLISLEITTYKLTLDSYPWAGIFTKNACTAIFKIEERSYQKKLEFCL